ncbi:MAG: acyl-CoA thioesterase [Clostridia bacterium]|nr:acyl-CoA thioesterase [Clostridia bacterium]MBP3360233.1 acyl-CoA thioesterase [Clostridia bacterium]
MKKTVQDSFTQQVQILTQSSMNGFGRLFGGQLMQWIDIVAAVTARRHSERNVTTVLVDGLEFKKAARANDTIVLTGRIAYAGKTSMEVCVNTYIEHLDGSKSLINKAHVVMVALDENDRPTEIPELELTCDEDRAEWQAALERRKKRSKL